MKFYWTPAEAFKLLVFLFQNPKVNHLDLGNISLATKILEVPCDKYLSMKHP